MFYNSYAKSLINYGIIAYGAMAKTKPTGAKLKGHNEAMWEQFSSRKKWTP